MPTTPQLQSSLQRSSFIQAPRSRVWRALTDIAQFCRWFRVAQVDAASSFQPGAAVRLRSTYEGPCYGAEFEMQVVEVVPESLFSWRWHPGAPIAGEDLSAEPPTLVEFRLEDADGGTRVTVTESGFDRLFAHRQAGAWKDNDGGWKAQLVNLEQYARDAH
jgi:uncharacterized protein YndB with AHSA1/START domain